VTVLTSADVSVVIPTFNREERLHRVLSALARQAEDGFEVVVVSDGSTDGTDEYLRSSQAPLAVVAERQANAGPAAARNRGVQLASRELLIFVDDDVVPTPQLVGAHVAAHARLGDRAVVIGPMLNPPDHDMTMWIRYEQAMLAKQYDAMERGDWSATSRQFYTGNASILKKHLVSAGGFDTELRRAEDIELALRLDSMGLEFTYVPEAIGLHYAERSFESWREIARAYGRSDVSFASAPGREELLRFVMVQSRRRNVLVKGVFDWRRDGPRPLASSPGPSRLRRTSATASVSTA
jgi:GT2 family glycosyltransferase